MNPFQCLAHTNTPISDAITMMCSSPLNKHMAGIVVVIDQNRRVVGVVTDGDVRRGLANGVELHHPVSRIANSNPVVINHKLSRQMMRKTVMAEARRRNAHYLKYDKLILVEDDKTFFDVIPIADILETQVEEKVVAVYGLGFVGLTLACTFANSGLSVIGIDRNPELIEKLRNGTSPFYEKGLDSALTSLAATNPIHFGQSTEEREADIHVVCVGTPTNPDGTPDLSHLVSVTTTISNHLKPGDLVIFRSTVPLGTTRGVALPILEQSGLKCGHDFMLAFAPERTVEGNALEELRSLPQIVGGFDDASSQLTAKLFGKITSTNIEVGSLEEAELVKLLNNTFRDLVFAFANEVASICDDLNTNAFNLIRAANEGYPRDRIPMPSPGVGGACLSKDPYLYTKPFSRLSVTPILGQASRAINERGAEYVHRKLTDFARYGGRNLSDLRILIIGIAFKGQPETSDMRASVALDLIERLPVRTNLRVKDFVIPTADLLQLGCEVVDGKLGEAFCGMDAVLIMNNHYNNNKFNIIESLRRCNQPTLFFDGWCMFDQREIEALGTVCYATMGYMTPRFLK